MSDQVTPVVTSPEASVLMGGLSPVRAGLTSRFLPPPGAWAGRRERGSEAVAAYGPAGGRAPGRGPADRVVVVADQPLDSGRHRQVVGGQGRPGPRRELKGDPAAADGDVGLVP